MRLGRRKRPAVHGVVVEIPGPRRGLPDARPHALVRRFCLLAVAAFSDRDADHRTGSTGRRESLVADNPDIAAVDGLDPRRLFLQSAGQAIRITIWGFDDVIISGKIVVLHGQTPVLFGAVVMHSQDTLMADPPPKVKL